MLTTSLSLVDFLCYNLITTGECEHKTCVHALKEMGARFSEPLIPAYNVSLGIRLASEKLLEIAKFGRNRH